MSERRTYPVRAVTRAREHARHGWSVNVVRRLIADEFGISPTWHTVKRWIDDDYRQRWLARNAKSRREYARRARRHMHANLSPDYKLERLAMLRERGVSLRACAQVAAVFWDDHWSAAQVETLLAGGKPRQREAAA